MIDEDKLNKTVIYINSSNSTFKNNQNFEFIYDMIEPIKNVLYIKLMKTEIFLKPTEDINGIFIEDGDPIFIGVKDHHRLAINISGNNAKCFELVLLNLSEKFGTNIPNNIVSFKTEYTSPGCHANDVNIVTMNPVIPILSRFEFTLYDKNFNIIPKEKPIHKCAITMCIYHSRRKTTQF